MICLGLVIGIERPTGICGKLLGGGSGGGRIRREENGGMGVHAMWRIVEGVVLGVE